MSSLRLRRPARAPGPRRHVTPIRPNLERLEERAVPALSAWWADAGVGGPTLVGATSTDASGAVTIRGAGAGLGGTADQFQFHYRELTGDGTLVANLPAGGIPGPQQFSGSKFGP